jgi:lysozyme family protein
MRALVAGIMDREGGYVDHPADRGGPTRWGITEAVARANGYAYQMRDLPRALAEKIYAERYVTGPGFDKVAGISERIAEELADSGVNFGPTVPSVWLQRWLNGFNRRGRDYADLRVDGALGPVTLAALKAFLETRAPEGEGVLFAALNCSQGARYLELAEGRESQESFLYGWVRGRVAEHLK